jgi:hypothetical protein
MREGFGFGDNSFGNPKHVRDFKKLKIGASCRTCNFWFDANTVVAKPSSGGALMPVQGGGQQRTIAERLSELDDLRKAGVITQEEYNRKREEILQDL